MPTINFYSLDVFETVVPSSKLIRSDINIKMNAKRRMPFNVFRIPVVKAQSESESRSPVATSAPSEGFFTKLLNANNELKTKVDSSMFAPIPGETGWDRIRCMYSTDKFGQMGPEWNFIVQGFYLGTFTGATIGFFVGGRNAARIFVDKNEATKFLNEMAAKRALQDKMTLSMFNYAFKWGWRTGLFTMIYLLVSTNVSVYRGKSSIWDYVAAGGVTGASWKFIQGPTAMLIAGSLGGVLGLFAGAMSLGALRVAGMTMEEVRYWHYQSQILRQGEVIGKVLPESASTSVQSPDAVHQMENSPKSMPT